SSNSDDGYSFSTTVTTRVEEKIDKDWVFCNEKEEKVVGIEDQVKGCVGDELGSGVVIKEVESVGGVGECYVFDEMSERSEVYDGGVELVGSDEGNVGEDRGLLRKEECGSLVGIGGECYVFDEMPERSEVDDGDVGLVESDEDCVKFDGKDALCAVVDGEGKVDEEGEVIDDDDWQGIETTELEKRFGAAVAFVDSKTGVDRVNLIDNDVKVELYGLHKVAIEGSCFEPQPMALKVAARANWNSWKRLENLGREDAMEQYIALLSQHVPDWIGRQASI
ncbi:hypothetical protein M8C21_012743, partial [Ambrosia artemisiifolia]